MEEWQHHRNQAQRQDTESQEDFSTVVGSDGGGRFPFLVNTDDPSKTCSGGTDTDTDTDTDTGGMWSVRGHNNSSFKPRRWTTGSFSGVERQRNGVGAGGDSVSSDVAAASPRSRLREAALGAAVAGGSGSGGGGDMPASACYVPLRCAGSGADLASRVHEFLASERKVCESRGVSGCA